MKHKSKHLVLPKAEFWSDLPQNLMQPFPHPMMLNIKFDLRLEIFKFESVDDDDDGPLLALWANKSAPKFVSLHFGVSKEFLPSWFWNDMKSFRKTWAF